MQNETRDHDWLLAQRCSQSKLKWIVKGTRAFESRYIKQEIVDEPTDDMRFGSAAHCAILEPDRFEKEYAVTPRDKSDRRRKPFLDWFQDHYDTPYKGASQEIRDRILKWSDGEAIKRMTDAARAHPLVGEAIVNGQREYSQDWSDADTGVDCLSIMDVFWPSARLIIDLKVITVASEETVAKQIANTVGWLQPPHYLTGAMDVATDFIFSHAAIEKQPPWRVRAFHLDDADLGWCFDQHREAMRSYKRVRDSFDFAEFGENDLVRFSLPRWVKMR